MIPVTWALTFFRPASGPDAAKLSAIVWLDHRPVDLMVLGVWRRRVRWLPDWWPFNMAFHTDRQSVNEAMAYMRRWVAEQNAKETAAAHRPTIRRPLELGGQGGRP